MPNHSTTAAQPIEVREHVRGRKGEPRTGHLGSRQTELRSRRAGASLAKAYQASARRGTMNFLRGLRNPPGMTAKATKEISGDCSAPAGPELQDQVRRERPGGGERSAGSGG